MAISAEDITPAAEAAATPEAPEAPEADTKDEGEGGGLPNALLEAVPALGLLMEGAPPATYAPADSEYPELKVVEKHLKELGGAGFGVYGTQDGQNVVLFNGLLITPDEIKAADEAGQLDSVATPYDQLRNEFEAPAGEAGGGAQASVEAPGLPEGVAVAGSSGGQGAAPAPKSTTVARNKALSVGSPTSGPSPGSGRILNSIVKPVI